MKDDISPIVLNSREKGVVAQAGDWLGGNPGLFLNIKEFYIWFRYEPVFTWLRTMGFNVHAIQDKIHEGFVTLGLRLAKSTEALMHDGYDQLTSEKHYHLKQMVLYSLADEVLALRLKPEEEE